MNGDILYFIEICVLIGVILLRERQFAKERKDLLNRLMAKDLAEYKNITNPSIPKPIENPILRKMKERGGWIDARKPQS